MTALSEERESAANDLASADHLRGYASLLTATNHPPEECGDPSSCPSHGDAWWTYHEGRTARS